MQNLAVSTVENWIHARALFRIPWPSSRASAEADEFLRKPSRLGFGFAKSGYSSHLLNDPQLATMSSPPLYEQLWRQMVGLMSVAARRGNPLCLLGDLRRTLHFAVHAQQ